MQIKVIEKCEVDSDEKEGIRIVFYNSSKSTLIEAFKDYEENFNSDNIEYSDDEFEGACLDSVVIAVSQVL